MNMGGGRYHAPVEGSMGQAIGGAPSIDGRGIGTASMGKPSTGSVAIGGAQTGGMPGAAPAADPVAEGTVATVMVDPSDDVTPVAAAAADGAACAGNGRIVPAPGAAMWRCLWSRPCCAAAGGAGSSAAASVARTRGML